MSEKDKNLLEIRNKSKADRINKIRVDSKDRLKEISKKKFETCFIFCLAEFETTFGRELWGHGLQDNELTEAQLKNRDLWTKLRKDILNKGNTQRRALVAEIDLHNVEFEGYRMNLVGDKENG